MQRINATVLAATFLGCAASSPSNVPQTPEAAARRAPHPEAEANSASEKDCTASGEVVISDLPEVGLEGALVLHRGDVACLEAHAGAVAAVPAAAKDSEHLAIRVLTLEEMDLLEVHNAFPVTLQYRALLQVEGTAGWQETSIAPVLPGLSSFETWPQPIGALVLFDFQFAEEEPDEPEPARIIPVTR
jgi:hypothetical protein